MSDLQVIGGIKKAQQLKLKYLVYMYDVLLARLRFVGGRQWKRSYTTRGGGCKWYVMKVEDKNGQGNVCLKDYG